MASMFWSMRAVPKHTSMDRFSTTLNSTLVSKSPFLICSVMLYLVLITSFYADKSDGCTSSDILDDQCMGRKCSEKRSGLGAASRRPVTGCIVLFPAPIGMRTKYADHPETARIEV